jgi:sarcosine oxidase subunit gamma
MAEISPVLPPRADALAMIAAATPPLPAAELRTLDSDCARFVFRGREAAVGPAGESFGTALPRRRGAYSIAGDRIAIWLGPDEWLLLVPGASDPAPIAAAIEAATAGVPHSLVDVSHRQLCLEVSGPEAATVLAAGCPLDLSADAFPVGTATRTVLAKAEIVLARTGPDVFHIEVWRSFSAYVWHFLDEARREFRAG